MSEDAVPIGRGWRAHFEHEWPRDGWRLHIWRNAPDNRIEVITGDLVGQMYDPAEQVERSGIYLPGDAYQAIVTTIDPPAHKAEVARLEDALRVERERVDRILGGVVFGRDAASVQQPSIDP